MTAKIARAQLEAIIRRRLHNLTQEADSATLLLLYISPYGADFFWDGPDFLCRKDCSLINDEISIARELLGSTKQPEDYAKEFHIKVKID